MTERVPPQHPTIRPGRMALAVFLCCVVALGLRIYVRYGPPGHLFYGDAATGRPRSDAVTWYLHATHLYEGRGLGDSIRQFRSRNFVPPGHPAILATLRLLVGPDPVRIGWAVALLSSLLPWLAFLWTREMWGPRAGLWAAILAAIHPPFTHISFSLMSEPTAVITMAVALYFGARVVRRGRVRDALAAGLAFGLGVLVRPAVLAFLWGGVAAVFFLRAQPVRRRFLLAGLWLATAFIPLGLWQYRNYRVHGEWSAVYSSISARHVWTGANPQYRPYFYSRRAWHETMWRDPHAGEMVSIRRMQEEARAWILEDPLRYAASCVWRLSHLFPELRRGPQRIAFSQAGWSRMNFLVLFCFALAGLGLGLRTRTTGGHSDQEASIPGSLWSVSLLGGILVSLIGAGIYGAAARYRWPLEYAWLPFAALFLDGIMQAARRPLHAPQEVHVPWAPDKTWMRRMRVGAWGIIGGGFLLLAVLLVLRHRNPPAPESVAPVIAREAVRTRMEALGLLGEWEAQHPVWIRYADVFDEQARHYGAVTGLKDSLVVWWGLLRMPVIDEGGLRRGYLILDPRPGDIGGARLDLLRHPEAASLPGDWRDGQAILCIARLQYRARPVGRPELLAYDLLPGRFEDNGLTSPPRKPGGPR